MESIANIYVSAANIALLLTLSLAFGFTALLSATN